MNHSNQGKEEISEIIMQRANQYTHGIVKAVFASKGDGTWNNCVTYIRLCGGEPIETKSFIYPGFEMYEISLKPESIMDLVDDLVNKAEFHILNRIAEIKDGTFDRSGPGPQIGQHFPSGESWIRNDWPGNQFLFRGRREINPPSNPLIAVGMPAYPDAYAAIEHIVGIDARGGHTFDGGVVLFLPDFRARITSVALGIQNVSLKIEAKMAELTEIVGKIYAKSKDGMVIQSDFDIETEEKEIELGLQPEHVYIGIMYRPDGQIIDEWKFSPFRQTRNMDIEMFTPEYIQQLIEQGEDSNVEFKPGSKDDNAKREIAESAIAFSNRNGGIILVGVSDNAKVEGAFGAGWQDIFTQSLRDRCEPPIEPNVRQVVIQNKPIYVLVIPESTNKPHLMSGTGIVYIRVSSTDRPATRHELDELYELRQNIGLPFSRS